MNYLVVYKSRYGFTEGYAKYIASQLGCEAKDTTLVTAEDIEKADVLLYGGGVYAGAIAGSAFLNHNKDRLLTKKLIVFTTGLTQTDNYPYFQLLVARNVPAELRDACFSFHFYGGIDYKSLKFLNKVIISSMLSAIRHKPEKDRDEREMLLSKAKTEKIDMCDFSSTADLLERARNIDAPRDGDEEFEEEDLYGEELEEEDLRNEELKEDLHDKESKEEDLYGEE